MVITGTYWKPSEQDIIMAVEMLSNKKRLKQVAAVFDVSINTFYFALRRCGVTVKLIKEKVASKEKVQISIPPPKQRETPRGKNRKPKIASRHLDVILQQLEMGHNLQEIANALGISRQRVDQILKHNGFSIHDFKQNTKTNPEISEALLEHELTLKRQAFRAGLSVAEYSKLYRAIGRRRMAQLTLVERGMEGNKRLLEVVPSERMCQLSALEIFEVYTCTAQKLFPTLSTLEAFDMIMAQRFEYRITRIDRYLPFIVGNVEIVTAEEFGNRIAKSYGMLSPPNPLHRRRQQST